MEERPAHRPIYSRRADDAELHEALDAFAIGLAERIDELQDTEARGDYAGLDALVGGLAQEADRLGYPALAEAAAEVRDAARTRNGEGAHKALLAVTDLARRIRLGHRSSA